MLFFSWLIFLKFLRVIDTFQGLLLQIYDVFNDMIYFLMFTLIILCDFYILFYLVQIDIDQPSQIINQYDMLRYTYLVLIGDYSPFLKGGGSSSLSKNIKILMFAVFVAATLFL